MSRTRNARGGRRPRRRATRRRPRRRPSATKRRAHRRRSAARRGGSSQSSLRPRRSEPIAQAVRRQITGASKTVPNPGHSDRGPSRTGVAKVPNTGASKTKLGSGSNQNPKWAPYIASNLPRTATAQQKFDSWAKVQLDMAPVAPPAPSATSFAEINQFLNQQWENDDVINRWHPANSYLKSFDKWDLSSYAEDFRRK